MKNSVTAFLFLVSWQQYEVKIQKGLDGGYLLPIRYVVETIDHSITLANQSDVNKFVGTTDLKAGHFEDRSIGGHFNIKVERTEEK